MFYSLLYNYYYKVAFANNGSYVLTSYWTYNYVSYFPLLDIFNSLSKDVL